MNIVQGENRKGPWTEQEDIILVNFVHLFGDRRWDFIAKVSGLNRTGKSCRLRWVNYLNPGLKRGKMTPQEERLVLQLHAKWGNRWSKIARKLPGRTDNEIKNYWRTYTRKKAQQIKQGMPSPSSSSSYCCSSSISTTTMFDAMHSPDSGKASFDDTGGSDINVMNEKQKEQEAEECQEGYSMDDIWKEIDLSEENTIKPVNDFYLQEGSCFYCPVTASSEWEHSTSIWRMDADKTEISPPLCHYTACSKHGVASFIG